MSDVLVDLEALVDGIPTAIEARKLKNSLGRTVDKLVEVPRQAARFEALVEVAIALGASADPTAKRSLSEAVDEAEEIGELLVRAQTPDDLQYATEDLSKLTQALRNLDNVARQLWRNVVQSEFQSLTAVGALLGDIANTADLGKRMQALSAEAQGVADRNTPTEQLAVEIQRLRMARAALDAELHKLTDNPDVDAFLTAVTRDAATLAHVTPAVVDWLTRNAALEAFLVRGRG